MPISAAGAEMNNPILRSFEIAAARCEDLTPLVYRRLFRDHPEAEAMFRRDGGDLVKGSMLAFAVDAMLDYAGDRRGHFRMIECEIVSHDAYGTPPELFRAFFRIIAETLRELIGADWSTDIENAWRMLLDQIDDVVASSLAAAQQEGRFSSASVG
jgi:hemoglobin-like flavoprotein